MSPYLTAVSEQSTDVYASASKTVAEKKVKGASFIRSQ